MIHEQFRGNLGALTEDEIEKLQASSISIAGCGCIGGYSAEMLARSGIGRINPADSSTFQLTEINRQCAANHHTLGQNKAIALKRHLLSINPDLKVQVFSNSIDEENAELFVSNCDYVIDAVRAN